jgi:hypothetical protein
VYRDEIERHLWRAEDATAKDLDSSGSGRAGSVGECSFWVDLLDRDEEERRYQQSLDAALRSSSAALAAAAAALSPRSRAKAPVAATGAVHVACRRLDSGLDPSAQGSSLNGASGSGSSGSSRPGGVGGWLAPLLQGWALAWPWALRVAFWAALGQVAFRALVRFLWPHLASPSRLVEDFATFEAELAEVANAVAIAFSSSCRNLLPGTAGENVRSGCAVCVYRARATSPLPPPPPL